MEINMAISKITAMMIQGNKDNIKTDIDEFEGKFSGNINLYKGGNLHTPIFSTGYAYGTRKIAKIEIQKILDFIINLKIK